MGLPHHPFGGLANFGGAGCQLPAHGGGRVGLLLQEPSTYTSYMSNHRISAKLDVAKPDSCAAEDSCDIYVRNAYHLWQRAIYSSILIWLFGDQPKVQNLERTRRGTRVETRRVERFPPGYWGSKPHSLSSARVGSTFTFKDTWSYQPWL